MKEPSKILIVNAYGRSNRGDSVLLDECVSDCQIAFPQASVEVALFEHGNLGALDQGQHLVRLGNANRFSGILAKFETLFYLAVAWVSRRHDSALRRLLPDGQRETLNVFSRSDMIVSAPGGYIHDTNAAWIVALFHLALGQVMGKEVILAPQSIGPFKNGLSRWLVGRILDKCNVVCIRDPESYDFVRNVLHLSEDKLRKTGDSAFWNIPRALPPAEVEDALSRIGLSRSEPFIGGTAVGWSFPGSANPAASLQKYVEVMSGLFLRMHAKFGLRTVLFNQVSDDLTTARAIAARSNGKVLVQEESPDPDLLRGLIGSSRVFVGTRFHSCIFAMLANVPTTAIAYLPKTSAIMNDLGMDKYVLIDEIDVDRIEDWISFDLNNAEFARKELAAAIEHYRSVELQFSKVLRSREWQI